MMEPIKKQTFLSDILDIYRIAESGLPERIYDGIPLDEQTVGYRRAFEAMQAGHTIQRVVRIPVVPDDLNGCFVTIRAHQYQVLLAQLITDTTPKCLQLSLEQPDICWALEQEE